MLPKIRTQYVGLLRGGFETEFRTLERLANPTGDQQARRLELEQWNDELQTFDRLLEDVSSARLRPGCAASDTAPIRNQQRALEPHRLVAAAFVRDRRQRADERLGSSRHKDRNASRFAEVVAGFDVEPEPLLRCPRPQAAGRRILSHGPNEQGTRAVGLPPGQRHGGEFTEAGLRPLVETTR